MIELNNLYEIAEKSGIYIECFESKTAESFSISNKDYSVIVINPLLLRSPNDERVKVAHELGHFKTGAFYSIHSSADTIKRHELKANRWAIRKLVPKSELIKAYKNGINDNLELADYFGVTEDFIQKVLAYYGYAEIQS